MVELYTSDKLFEIARKMKMSEDDLSRCGKLEKIEKDKRWLVKSSLYLPDNSIGFFFYTDFSLIFMETSFNGKTQTVQIFFELFYREDKKFPLKHKEAIYVSESVKFLKKNASKIKYMVAESKSYMKRFAKQAKKTDKINTFKFFK